MAKKRSSPVNLDENSLFRNIDYVKLSKQREHQLIEDAQRGDPEALEELVKNNVRLVFKYAKKHRRSNCNYEDLVQVGLMGLLRAVSKFDFSRQKAFSTVAGIWIEQAVRRESKSSRVVHIPEGRIQKVFKLRKLESEGSPEAPAYTTQELCRILKVPSAEKLDAIRHQAISTTSLEAFEDSNDEVVSPLDSCTAPSFEDEIMKLEESRCLSEGLNQLPRSQRELLCLRYGLYGFEKMTRTNLAKKVGLTIGTLSGELDRALVSLREILTEAS